MVFEQVILKAIYSLVGVSNFLDGLLALCGDLLIYGVVIVFLWALFVHHREHYERLTKFFYSSLGLIISVGVLRGLLSYLISRPAPAQALNLNQFPVTTVSFPAGMTVWAVAIAMIVFVALSKRMGFWLFIIAGIIGFAQLYSGLYWPLDVAVAVLIGIAGPVIAARIIRPTRN